MYAVLHMASPIRLKISDCRHAFLPACCLSSWCYARSPVRFETSCAVHGGSSKMAQLLTPASLLYLAGAVHGQCSVRSIYGIVVHVYTTSSVRYFVHTCGHPSDCRGSPSMMDRDPDSGPKVGSDMQWLHNVDPAGRGPVPSLPPSSSRDGLAVGCTSLECCLTAPHALQKSSAVVWPTGSGVTGISGATAPVSGDWRGTKRSHRNMLRKALQAPPPYAWEVWMNGLSCAPQRFQVTRKL
ncbi:hypothetical protein B0T26DRAFT_205755 [Lasiosphaeria miniovina]|uniref:Uncharacterized protein n=1 Tax=Lasiosphaeria miniovina TaxID=1954250 RepID=A0AA40AUG2_9PEZI|nr:uncharacterized protein B0T26DRAFT_205755 [Lasiosphaeria miniovina]KAK0722168.1 hypothetical protein B0T26DRAFT_205755 [Lasiosphaeria miniovina]